MKIVTSFIWLILYIDFGTLTQNDKEKQATYKNVENSDDNDDFVVM